MQAHGRIWENSTKKKIRLSPKNRCAFPKPKSNPEKMQGSFIWGGSGLFKRTKAPPSAGFS